MIPCAHRSRPSFGHLPCSSKNLIIVTQMIVCCLFTPYCCINLVCGGEGSWAKACWSALAMLCILELCQRMHVRRPESAALLTLLGWVIPCQFFLFPVVCCVTELIDPIYKMNYVCGVTLSLPCAECSSLTRCKCTLFAVFYLYCSVMYLQQVCTSWTWSTLCCSTAAGFCYANFSFKYGYHLSSLWKCRRKFWTRQILTLDFLLLHCIVAHAWDIIEGHFYLVFMQMWCSTFMQTGYKNVSKCPGKKVWIRVNSIFYLGVVCFLSQTDDKSRYAFQLNLPSSMPAENLI